MNDPKYCPTPGCKEDLIDRISKAIGVLHSKINLIAKTKISKAGTCAVAALSVTIILGITSLMYGSYASARDDRIKQIIDNRCAIEIVKNQQVEIKTKLDIELHYIKNSLKKNEELTEKVLNAINKRNGDAERRSGID